MPSAYTGEELLGTLALAYGEHVVSGHIIQKVTTGSGDTAETTVIVWLGEGVWNRIVGAYWGGGLISETNYHFHNGYLSDSMDEAVFANGEWTQGVDPWNYGGQTYSGTAYIIVKLPQGITKDDDMGKLKFVCECLRVPNFDASGNQIDIDGNVVANPDQPLDETEFFYSTNPARVFADLVLVRRGLSRYRINWSAWVAWRENSDQTITWVGGTPASRPVYVNVSANLQQGADASLTKIDGFNSWNAGATTETVFPDGVDALFEIDAGAGTWAAGLTTSPSISNSNQLYIGLQGNVSAPGDEEGILSVNKEGVNTVIGNWVAGDRFRFASENGQLRIYKNGILMNTTLPPYVSGLRGAIALFHEGADILRATIQPVNTGVSGGERVRKRFECGLAFPNQTDIAAAIESVLFVSCSHIQQAEGQFVVLPPQTRAPSFTFNMSNIIEGTFKTYRLSRDQRPTRIIGKFRDADSPTLKEDQVPVDRDELVDILGRENVAPDIWLGTMTRGQAQVVMNYHMRMMSDLDLFCSFEADGTSWPVLPGDVVTVEHDVPGWGGATPPKFLVIEVTDNASTSSPDTRTFTCQIYNDNTYSETDQTPLVANITPTIPTALTPPSRAVRIELEKVSSFGANNVYTTTIRGRVVFSDFLLPQRGRIYMIDPTMDVGAAPRITSIIVDEASPVFEVLATSAGTYKFYVLTENQYGVKAIDDPLLGTTDEITIDTLAPPPPVDLYGLRIARDLAITWKPGIIMGGDIHEHGEHYIVRIRDLSTNEVLRKHDIITPDAIPCKWGLFTADGNPASVHLDPDGTIECDAGKGGDLAYISQVFNVENGFVVLFNVDSRHIGRLTVYDSTISFLTNISVYNRAGFTPSDPMHIGVENLHDQKRVLSPLSEIGIEGLNGQAEYTVNKQLWVRSSKGVLPKAIQLYLSFLPDSVMNENQAFLKVRVRPLNPHQFVYTEKMQETDYAPDPVPDMVQIEVTQVVVVNGVEVESLPAITVT